MPEYLTRRPRPEDLNRIKEIASGYDYPLPDKFITAAAVEKEGRLIAFGVTQGIIEASFFCTGSKRDRVHSTKELIRVASEDMKEQGYTQLYSFVLDPKFADITIKHLGFDKVPGIPVYLNLR